MPIGRLSWQRGKHSSDIEPLPRFISPIKTISDNHAHFPPPDGNLHGGCLLNIQTDGHLEDPSLLFLLKEVVIKLYFFPYEV